MKLKFVAPFTENSGYGETARGYVRALAAVAQEENLDISLQDIDYKSTKAILTKDEERVLAPLFNKNLDPDTVLMYCIPEQWPQFFMGGKRNIGMTVWETSRIPENWVTTINHQFPEMQQGHAIHSVITPSRYSAQALKDSGVTRPIHVVPYTIDMTMADQRGTPIRLNGVKDDDFKLFAASQFTERKNFVGLLRAYYAAFHGVQNVVLILKTYLREHSSSDQNAILNLINQIKQSMNLPSFPRVVLINQVLSREEMLWLYQNTDAYVMLHRGEGWGMGQMEAGLSGRPIITTAYGGVTDFLDEQSAFMVGYTETPVFGMWGFYQGTQMWAEPDMKDAINKMRQVYTIRSKGVKLGKNAQSRIVSDFNFSVVGTKLAKALKA